MKTVKTYKLFSCLLAFIILLSTHEVLAEESSEEATQETIKSWGGEGEIGYTKTTGNTETTNLNASLGLTYERNRWSHEAGVEALFSEDSGETTSERYVLFIRSNYSLSERNYLFVKAEYEDDRFTGYEYKVNEVVGFGRKVINSEKVFLKVEAGPGGRHSKSTGGDRDDEIILYAGGEFEWKFSKTASLGEEIMVEIGEENTQSESVTYVKTTIIGNLAMKTSYTIRHNSSPPEESRSTDTMLTVTMVYSF